MPMAVSNDALQCANIWFTCILPHCFCAVGLSFSSRNKILWVAAGSNRLFMCINFLDVYATKIRSVNDSPMSGVKNKSMLAVKISLQAHVVRAQTFFKQLQLFNAALTEMPECVPQSAPSYQ